MTDRPIIFSAPMVRALLDGRKTQTRRLAWRSRDELTEVETEWTRVQPGDRLWVREAFMPRPGLGALARPHYRADPESDRPEWRRLWKPSIHMPRWASRLTLTVTEVRRQRLQEITERDARAEGILFDIRDGVPIARIPGIAGWEHSATALFGTLWEQLHGDGAWLANPEIVALTFTVARGNIDARDAA